MIKAAVKKLILLFAAVLLCFGAFTAVSFNGFAANGIEMRLAKLQKDFPSGWYYNHKVVNDDDKKENLLSSRDERYAKSVTRYPCVDHGGVAEKGTYDCNYFDGGYQCHGFASMLFYQVFGQRQTSLEKNTKKPFIVKAGDLVRLHKDTHSAVVLAVKGDTFTVAECNVSEQGAGESCKISWGRTYKTSDITYFMRADNYDEVSKDTNWKHIEKKQNTGNSFYAAVYNGSKALSIGSNNSLTLKKYTGSANQVWKFTRQSNGSYKIASCKNGKLITVQKAADGKAVAALAAENGAKSQLWAFYQNGNGYYLSADSTVNVLCVSGSGNVYSAKKTADGSRVFSLKVKKAPVATVIKAKGANGSVSLSWSKGKYTKSFDIEIFDASSKLYKAFENLTSTSLKASLPAGNYSAKIVSKNAFSKTDGNRVYFTVGKKGELGKTAKVTSERTKSSISLSWSAVPGADGYGIFIKQGNEWKTLAATEKTSYTVNNLQGGKKYTLAVRAFEKSKSGKISLAKEYTTFTAATKVNAPSEISASQTASSIKVKWSSVKGADGYRLYLKTDSGWKNVATTSKTGKTVKGLSSGKAYTYGVRAYIKTDLGYVWSSVISINTATKPKAPELSVSDVKQLKAKIRWNKVSGADGYQVFYKFDDSDGYTHLANYKASDGGIELTKLSSGVYYTFAVRAYKKVDGKTVYGDYSTVRFKAKYL